MKTILSLLSVLFLLSLSVKGQNNYYYNVGSTEYKVSFNGNNCSVTSKTRMCAPVDLSPVDSVSIKKQLIKNRTIETEQLKNLIIINERYEKSIMINKPVDGLNMNYVKKFYKKNKSKIKDLKKHLLYLDEKIKTY